MEEMHTARCGERDAELLSYVLFGTIFSQHLRMFTTPELS